MTYICTACGHQGEPKKFTQGSFIGEASIWIVLLVIGLYISMWVLILGLIYTLYRATSTKNVCTLCNNPQIIPLDSPNGKLLAKKFNQP